MLDFSSFAAFFPRPSNLCWRGCAAAGPDGGLEVKMLQVWASGLLIRGLLDAAGVKLVFVLSCRSSPSSTCCLLPTRETSRLWGGNRSPTFNRPSEKAWDEAERLWVWGRGPGRMWRSLQQDDCGVTLFTAALRVQAGAVGDGHGAEGLRLQDSPPCGSCRRWSIVAERFQRW